MRLAREVGEAGGPGSVCARPSGLLAEVRGRPDRHVDAWLASAAPDDHGPPAGLVTLVTSGGGAPPRCSISWLVVHPAFRRQGLGRLLVQLACTQAWDRAAPVVWVECRADWTDAMAFWQAVGFSSSESCSR